MDYNEFIVVSVYFTKLANDEHFRKVFTLFDRNKSGYIEIEDPRDAILDHNDDNNEEIIISIMHYVDVFKVGNICTLFFNNF